MVWCVGVQAQVKETIDATLNRISSSGVKGASYFTGACLPHAQCYLPTTPSAQSCCRLTPLRAGLRRVSGCAGSIISVERDAKNGAYLAVSSRGNFFLTWEPGQEFWVPHNRGTARRIQNMGFVEVSTHAPHAPIRRRLPSVIGGKLTGSADHLCARTG